MHVGGVPQLQAFGTAQVPQKIVGQNLLILADLQRRGKVHCSWDMQIKFALDNFGKAGASRGKAHEPLRFLSSP